MDEQYCVSEKCQRRGTSESLYPPVLSIPSPSGKGHGDLDSDHTGRRDRGGQITMVFHKPLQEAGGRSRVGSRGVGSGSLDPIAKKREARDKRERPMSCGRPQPCPQETGDGERRPKGRWYPSAMSRLP